MFIELYDSLENRMVYDQTLQQKMSEIQLNNAHAFAVMVDSGIYSCMGSILEMLETEEFCVGCMYHRLDLMRRSITRYFSVETIINPDVKEYFLSVSEICTKFCIYLKQEFTVQLTLKECNRIKNPAYEEIITRFIERDSEQEEEDEG
jgi:hypothetical protein